MTTDSDTNAVIYDAGYLGCMWIERRDDAPATMHVVRSEAGRLAYFDNRYVKVVLRPHDRSLAKAIIDDDTEERQAAFLEALRQDRWVNVMLRP